MFSLISIAQNLYYRSNEDSEHWTPPALEVESVEAKDWVYMSKHGLFGEVIRIMPDPYALNEYDAELVAYVHYYDPEIQSYRTDHLYEGECYVIDREV